MLEDLRDDGIVRRLAVAGVEVFIGPAVLVVLDNETVALPQVEAALRRCSAVRRPEPGDRYDCQGPDTVGRLLQAVVEVIEIGNPGSARRALLVEALKVHRGAWPNEDV